MNVQCMADCSYNVQQAYGSIQAGQMCVTQSYLNIWVVSSRTKMYVTQSVFFTFELFQAGQRCMLLKAWCFFTGRWWRGIQRWDRRKHWKQSREYKNVMSRILLWRKTNKPEVRQKQTLKAYICWQYPLLYISSVKIFSFLYISFVKIYSFLYISSVILLLETPCPSVRSSVRNVFYPI